MRDVGRDGPMNAAQRRDSRKRGERRQAAARKWHRVQNESLGFDCRRAVAHSGRHMDFKAGVARGARHRQSVR